MKLHIIIGKMKLLGPKHVAVSFLFAVLFLIGISWRTYYIFYEHPATDYIYSDMNSYVSSAKNMVDPNYKPVIGDTLYPPGMSFFLGGLYLLDRTWGVALLAQWLIAVLIPFLIGLTGYKLFGYRTALLSAAIASLYYPFIDYASYFLSENPFTFLLLLTMLFTIYGFKARSRIAVALLGLASGIIAGMTASLRSVILVPALLAGVYLLVLAYKHRLKQVPILLCSALIGLGLIIIPLSQRCTTLNEGRFCLISTNSGLNFLQGHYGHTSHFKFDDKKRGYYYEFGNPTKLYKRYEEEARIPFGPYDSHALMRYAKNWIWQHPLDALLISVEHVFDLFFGSVTWPTSHTVHQRWALLFQQLYLVFILLPALFIVQRRSALILRFSTSAFSEALMFLPLLGVMLTVFLTIGEIRYRIPFDAFTMILAARFYAGVNHEQHGQIADTRSINEEVL